MLRHEDLTEPDLLRLLYSKDCYRTFFYQINNFLMVLIETVDQKTKFETPRPRSQKFENPRRKETQENEISRLIEISRFRNWNKISETLNFPGTIRHP